jgi:hypothetical protein
LRPQHGVHAFIRSHEVPDFVGHGPSMQHRVARGGSGIV